MSKTLYGMLAWFLGTLFVVYSFCLNTAPVVFSDVIKSSLNISTLNVTFSMGAFIAGFALIQIPASYMLISFSHNFLSFSLANFLQGVGASFAFIAAAILISQ